MTNTGVSSTYAVELDSAGAFVMSRRFGGGAGTSVDATSIKVDSAGSIYLTGSFRGKIDFNPGSATSFLDAGSSSSNAYVAKLDTNGNFGWAKSIGEATHDQLGVDIAWDASGNVYVGGNLGGATTQLGKTTGDIVVSNPGGDTAFLLKYATATGNLVSARTFDASSLVTISGLAFQGGKITVAGAFAGAIDLDPTSGKVVKSSAGDQDAFVVTLLG